MQPYDKFAALQLDIRALEHRFRQPDGALTIVERHHVVSHLVQHIADPRLHDGFPELVGALVGRMQVAVRAHLHQEARAVARRRPIVLRGVRADDGRADMRVAALDLEHGLFAGRSLVQIEHQCQRRSEHDVVLLVRIPKDTTSIGGVSYRE